ncbi:MAG: response regulator [Chitinophagaceae bacterium]|jgi:DNA-binding response OmpR family regulator|nr:response regulator [Chitinophagaceae bacterium]
MKILIAEDEPLILQTIELKLKKEGYEVIACVDGLDALQKIDSEKPDLIITDIMMPYMSGLEVIRKVKQDIHSKNIPVIVLSTMGQENIVEEAFELGADDYLKKPFSLSELSIRIKKIARQSKLQ